MAGGGSSPLGVVLANDWQSPGPYNLRYLNSTAAVVLAMGPVGCAKTSTAFLKGMVNTTRQPVLRSTGRKECKIVVVSDTYKNVHGKTLDTFKGILNRGHRMVKSVGGKGEDVMVEFIWGGQDGIQHRTIWHFIAVGDKTLEAATAGLLPTCVQLIEADKLPDDTINFFATRIPRWPDPSDFTPGDRPFSQLYGDFNAPNDTHPLYRRLSLKTNPDDEFIDFPSGFSPDAENMHNLKVYAPAGENYYRFMAKKMDDEFLIKRMLENKVGYSRSGKPVYEDYRADLHTAANDNTAGGALPLIIGVDGGGSAAAVVCQPTYSGHLQVLDEIVTEPGDFADAESFGKRVALLLSLKYPGRAAVAVIDPAESKRGVNDAEKTSWFQTFQTFSGLRCFRPKTNKVMGAGGRIAAVRTLLKRLIGGVPALQVNAGCMVLREGFQSGYKIKEFRTSEGVRYDEKPDKGHFSHIHDALQYACMFHLEPSERLQNAVHSASRASAPHGAQSRPKIIT